MHISHVEGRTFDYFSKTSLRTIIFDNKWITENMSKPMIYQGDFIWDIYNSLDIPNGPYQYKCTHVTLFQSFNKGFISVLKPPIN